MLQQKLTTRLLLACVLTIAGYLIAQCFVRDYDTALPDARIDITKVYYSPEPVDTPPDETDLGRPLSLPYNWKEAGYSTNADNVTGWYTAVIDLNVPPNRLWVVYFPNISSESSIFLNNEILGRGTKLNDRLGHMRQRPLYLNIPNGILRSGKNTLQVYIHSSNGFFNGSLETFYLGPEQAFETVYSKQFFLEVTLIKVIAIVLLLAALGYGAIWLLRREESLYGWFALGCLLWSSHIFGLFHTQSSWLINYLEYLFRYITITWFTAMLVIIAHRYQLTVRPISERAIFAVATGITIALPLTPTKYSFLVSNYLVGLFALSMIAWTFFSLLLNQARRGTYSDFFVALSVAIVFFLSINDLISALVPDVRKYTGMTAHYGAPFFVVALSWKLIRDFVNARVHAEELNRSLERRIAVKSQELEENFERLRDMEQRNLLAQERDRLIMDMHDGLGGQLMSAVSMMDSDTIDRSAVSDTLKDALADLRLMIDALDPTCDDLAMVLGSYRDRLEKYLANTDIRLVWKVRDVPPNDDIKSHTTLQILRILQEAVTNALKHANASEITVETGTENERGFVIVSDNGRGLPDGQTVCGRGLGNIQRRADAINATLQIESNTNGTALKLTL